VALLFQRTHAPENCRIMNSSAHCNRRRPALLFSDTGTPLTRRCLRKTDPELTPNRQKLQRKCDDLGTYNTRLHPVMVLLRCRAVKVPVWGGFFALLIQAFGWSRSPVVSIWRGLVVKGLKRYQGRPTVETLQRRAPPEGLNPRPRPIAIGSSQNFSCRSLQLLARLRITFR